MSSPMAQISCSDSQKKACKTTPWQGATANRDTAPSTLCIPESSPIHTQFTLPTDGFRLTLHCRDIFAEGKTSDPES